MDITRNRSEITRRGSEITRSGSTITQDDWRMYCRTRDSKLREQLILANLPLVRRIAWRLTRRLPAHITVPDIIHTGVIGLLQAIDRYDPDSGTAFFTFAAHRIVGAILDELRRQDLMPRQYRAQAQRLARVTASLQRLLHRAPTDEELALALGMPLAEYHHYASHILPPVFLSLDACSEETLEKVTEDSSDEDWTKELVDGSCPDPFSEAAARDRATLLHRMINSLSPQERIVLQLYYTQDLGIYTIGKRLGVTGSRVSQIHTSAKTRMREKLGRRHLTRDELLGDASATWPPSRRIARV